MPKQQRIVHFGGNVQGVGFRCAACRVAGRFDVTGYVKNLADGNVECVVEGEAAEIDAFVEALTDAMAAYVRKTTQQTAPHQGRYKSFTVAF